MKKKFLLAISFFILTINFSSAEIINLENPTFDKDIFIPKNKTIEKIINEKVNDWYGVYISNKKVGWYNGSFNKFNDDLYKIEEKLYLLMDMPGLEEGSKITTESKITGIEKIVSITSDKDLSKIPPKYPLNKPSGTPIIEAQEIASNKNFENFILVMIILSSIVLAAEGPTGEEPSAFMNVIDILFNIIFIGEALVKIIAMGFILPKKSYLRDNWNILDFIIVLSGILTMILMSFPTSGNSENIGFMKVLRMLRVLRPLKTISRYRGMQLVVRCLMCVD